MAEPTPILILRFLILAGLLMAESSTRADFVGASQHRRIMSQQDLAGFGDEPDLNLMLAGRSLEIQRRAFLSIIQPYLNRPESDLATADYLPEVNSNLWSAGQHTLNKDSSIHLRVLRSNPTDGVASRKLHSTFHHPRNTRRRTPHPAAIRPSSHGLDPSEDYSQLIADNEILLEVSETKAVLSNFTDSDRIIKDVPMLERCSMPQFGGMVTLYTRTNPLRLLYYGNWCGSGGMGPALDEIDHCCMTHDKCYGKVEKEPCLVLFQKPYTVHYPWKWVDEKKQAYCLRTGDKCAELTCECDRMAAECFSKFVIDAKLEGSRLRKHRTRGNPLLRGAGQH